MSKRVSSLLVVLLSGIITLGYYFQIVFSPNSYFFSNAGDASKNYYVFANYISNSNRILEFDQMNYPFGESIFFTDCIPVLSIPLKLISTVFPVVSEYSVGILNILLLCSIPFCALLLYRIYKLFGINNLIAILFAIAFSFLCPQSIRLNGHYALSFSFFVPLILYLLIKYSKEKQKTLIALSSALLLGFGIHGYLGVMSSAFIICYSVCLIVINHKKNLYRSIQLFLAAVFPVIIFLTITKFSDIHLGRTTNPWGIFYYHADLSTIFLPYQGLLNNVKVFLFPKLLQGFEGAAYLGVVTLLSFVVIVIILIKRLFKYKGIKLIAHSENSFQIKTLFIASIPIFLLSMLYPFRWNLEFLLDVFPLIKQFRAIGRFAWIFYFISSIVAVGVIDYIFKALKVKSVEASYLLVFLTSALTFAESYGYHHHNKQMITPSFLNRAKTWDELKIVESKIKGRNYQAMVALPFFHVGSENFEILRSAAITQLAFASSYLFGMPMVNNMSGRTSIFESKMQMSTMGSSFYEKKVKDYYPNMDSLLIVTTKESYLNSEENLLAKSNLIIETSNFRFYDVAFVDLFENTSVEEWDKYERVKSTFYNREGFLVNDTNAYFLSDAVSNLNNPVGTNQGFIDISGIKVNEILPLNIKNLEVGQKYIIRLWVYNEGKNFGQDVAKGHLYFNLTLNNGSIVDRNVKKPEASFELTEKWTLVENNITITEDMVGMNVIFQVDEKKKTPTIIKDPIFYEEGLTIYKELGNDSNKVLFKNNHRIVKPNRIN